MSHVPFTAGERISLAERFDDLVPGSAALGAVDYLERLLGALDHDPPQVWAAPGSWSGGSTRWLELGPWERHAWEQRLASWEATYRRVLDGVATGEDERTMHEHACEATYGDPAYGGNRDGAGWRAIAFPEPRFPPAR